MLKNKFIPACLMLGAALSLNACTNALSEEGSTGTYYEGVITDIELIDLKSSDYDSSSNTLLGAAAGAILGNIINKHSGGTIAGAAIGGIAANLLSNAGNRGNGVRLSVDTDNGPVVVDMPFSCKYAVGKQVRLISGKSRASVMVKSGNRYTTATTDKASKCQKYYDILAN